MKFSKAYSFLKKDLQIIEKSLKQAIESDHPTLQEASIQLIEAGGKRIRPVFVLLSGQMNDYNISRLHTVAVSLELIHMATLVHDDVIDNSKLRRGKPTVKELYGNRVAMYIGDYILARALEKITTLEDPELHQKLSESLVEVCIGEIEQIQFKYNFNLQLRDYLRRIKRKTALLIATSCQLGAIAGNANRRDANRLYRYGYYIGMSYQIIDDILDFTATEKELGKPTAGDLLQGNITLPVLLAMRDKQFNQLVKKTFVNPDMIDEDNFTLLLEMLKQTDAIKASYQLSDRYLKKALQAIEPLPECESKQVLQMIAKSIGKRKV